jgi:hypothetical protein
MHDFALGHHPGGDPLHDLWDEPLGDLVHSPQRGCGTLGHTIAALRQARHHGTGLYDQLSDLRQQACQHLTLFGFALGKEMVLFDRSEDRLYLVERPVDPQHPMPFELRQGSATALRHPPQNARFVGIANGQLLRCRIGREDTDIGKAPVLGDMEDQRIDLLDPVFAQGCIGPGYIGMIPHLGAGVVLAANEYARHDVLGQIRLHVARVEVLHQHQHHQGYIQRDIPGQARAAIGIFAGLPPMACHHLEERLPRQGALELKQRVVVGHVERDDFAICACAWTDPRRTIAVFFHRMLLR